MPIAQQYNPELLSSSSMEFFVYSSKNVPATVNVSRFEGANGVTEYHLAVNPTKYDNFDKQLQWILDAYQNTLRELGLKTQTALLRRFFCSDLINQQSALKANPLSNQLSKDTTSAVSWICQPPISPAKVSLWSYHVDGETNIIKDTSSVIFQRGKLKHHWTTGLIDTTAQSSYQQTENIFEQYENYLQSHNMNLADNVIRTWLFVQNVDSNYMGLVNARRQLFEKRQLTQDTHYIASTGIQGTYNDPEVKVVMDAYAIEGVSVRQIEFIEAPEHMSNTHLYGVTFERATAIAYRNRKHIIVSGTASIDNQGKIVHPGDINLQLDRTLENVEALLRAAGGQLKDLAILIVYARDTSDNNLIHQKIRQRCGNMPIQILTAPVCRPGWLVEVEGKAIIQNQDQHLPNF